MYPLCVNINNVCVSVYSPIHHKFKICIYIYICHIVEPLIIYIGYRYYRFHRYIFGPIYFSLFSNILTIQYTSRKKRTTFASGTLVYTKSLNFIKTQLL